MINMKHWRWWSPVGLVLGESDVYLFVEALPG